MPKPNPRSVPGHEPLKVRRGYFECRYGQLHVHHAMPPGGGFEEGTPLLCLHECPGTARTFVPFLARVGLDRMAYAPDLPGFGESDAPVGPVAIADYAGALGDFLDTMRLRRIDVLALGRSGALAAELALARPAQVARLVLVGLASGATAASPAPALWERSLLQGIAEYPLRERFARVTAKVLAVRDRSGAPEVAARLRELLPSARVAEIEGGDLNLPAQAPERLHEAVRDFLRG